MLHSGEIRYTFFSVLRLCGRLRLRADLIDLVEEIAGYLNVETEAQGLVGCF